MITKLKYVGTRESSSLTQNQCYVVLGYSFHWNSVRAIIINDLGVPYATQVPIDDTSEWVLESVTECGEQVFPAP